MINNTHESIMEEMLITTGPQAYNWATKILFQLPPLLDHESNPFLIKIHFIYSEQSLYTLRSVTHVFGHSGDVSTSDVFRLPQGLFAWEKWLLSSSKKNIFKMSSQATYIIGCENPSFSQATQT